MESEQNGPEVCSTCKRASHSHQANLAGYRRFSEPDKFASSRGRVETGDWSSRAKSDVAVVRACSICNNQTQSGTVRFAGSAQLLIGRGHLERQNMAIERNPTRAVSIGDIVVGDGHPIAVQSMTATKTVNIDATVAQTEAYREAGAGVVRIAVDSDKDAAALAEIRKQTSANLAVDLQENFRLAQTVAPHVNKIRYNPGHLYHHQRDKPWQDKVRFIIDQGERT